MNKYCNILIPLLLLLISCEKNEVENLAPEASSLYITGSPYVYNKLTAHYAYSDVEDDREGATIYQWYTATDSTGTGSIAIPGATSKFYEITVNERGKYIGFSVIPVTSKGTRQGNKATIDKWAGVVTYDESLSPFAERLVGKWIYVKMCGGWTGGCDYPVNKHYKIVEITEKIFITTTYHNNNDSTKSIANYALKSRLHYTGVNVDTSFSIIFNDYTRGTGIAIFGNELGIAGGDFWEYYEKIK
jgi:hypothetical protein